MATGQAGVSAQGHRTARSKSQEAPGRDAGAVDQRDRGRGGVPGLDEGQAEHDGQQDLAEREPGGRPLDGEEAREGRGGEAEDGDLRAPGGEVPQGELEGAHRFSSMRFARASSSSGVRRSSSTRCARSGPAEPPKTRSTNSRTIEPTTFCCGRVGR